VAGDRAGDCFDVIGIKHLDTDRKVATVIDHCA
jgi:hypothetical protein